jgi:hypothetical protein
MLTYVGKFLVLLNAFAAVAVLAWSVAAYTTRVDAVDAVNPVTGEKWVAEMGEWNGKDGKDSRAREIQKGYAPALKEVADAEARLFVLRGQIARRLKQADDGVFYKIFADQKGGIRANPTDFERVGALDWTDDPKRVETGQDQKTPLAGVIAMRKNLEDQQAAASAHLDAIVKAVDQLTALNADITALDARYAWLQEVAKRHEAEYPVLVDLRVNWENRSGSLQRRRNQLLLRLDDLKGAKVGAVPPPAVPAGPALNLTPPNK